MRRTQRGKFDKGLVDDLKVCIYESMAKRERCEDEVGFGIGEKREKLKPKEECAQGGERVFHIAGQPNYAYGYPGAQDYGYDDDCRDYCDGCNFFSLFSSASRYARRETPLPELVPIAALHPNYSGKWATRGRVVEKSAVRDYNNRNGVGTYFWFEMKDDAGGEIRVTCFNYNIDKFYDKVAKDVELEVSDGWLREPKEEYNWNGRVCEIHLQQWTVLRVVGDARTRQGDDGAAQEAPMKAGYTIKPGSAQARNSQPANAGPGNAGPEEKSVQDDTLAVKAQNEILLEKVAALERNYEFVSSQAMESNSELQDCKARLQELEALIKEGRSMAPAS